MRQQLVLLAHGPRADKAETLAQPQHGLEAADRVLGRVNEAYNQVVDRVIPEMALQAISDQRVTATTAGSMLKPSDAKQSRRRSAYFWKYDFTAASCQWTLAVPIMRNQREVAPDDTAAEPGLTGTVAGRL